MKPGKRNRLRKEVVGSYAGAFNHRKVASEVGGAVTRIEKCLCCACESDRFGVLFVREVPIAYGICTECMEVPGIAGIVKGVLESERGKDEK